MLMDAAHGRHSRAEMSERTEWRVEISDFAALTDDPITTLVDDLRIDPNPEKDMIQLSKGDPTIFGNMKPPTEAIESLAAVVTAGISNGYTPASGAFAARQAVAQYSSTHGLILKPEDIILTSGCTTALDLSITVLAGHGKNILVPRPGFTMYKTIAAGIGVGIKYYDLDPEHGWEIDLEQMEGEIDKNTAAILVNNPSNPCGSVFSVDHLKKIVAVARRHYLPIIADEVYEHMVFLGSEFHPIASLSADVSVLSCSGLSKRFLVPGWRMGWIVIHERNGAFRRVRQGLANLSQRHMGTNALIQGALPTILQKTPDCYFRNTILMLEKNAQVLYKRLSQVPGLKPIMPRGAMFMMVGIDTSGYRGISGGIDFIEKLIGEESVFCLPGSYFQKPDYFRITLTAPENKLNEACDRIQRFCARYYGVPEKDCGSKERNTYIPIKYAEKA